MDPSLLKKLLAEDEDEDESMHSKDDIDAFQASLIREIKGGTSQQFAERNNGTQDAHTNNLHVLESTQMKESVLGSQDRELKPEYESPVHHNLPPSHVPQDSDLQSRNNSISTEPESLQPLYMKPQNVSVQRPHGVEQPVGSVKHDPTQLRLCELLPTLIPLVDKERGKQLTTLYHKFESNEVTKQSFLRQVRNIVGDQVSLWALRKLQQQGDKEVKVPDGPNDYSEPFTSAGSGTFSSSAPCQGPVTKDQTVSNDQTVAHVKQKLTDQNFGQVRMPCSLVRQDVSNVSNFASHSVKTQLDSSTMVNFSSPAATISPGTIETLKMPCVGLKKTLEAQGSLLPPLSKRQKLCETALAPSDIKFNDVTELSGINLMEEERELLSSPAKKDSRVFKSFRRVAHEEEGRTILQKVPVQRKLAEIMAKSGLKHIKNDVERCLSLCVEERMRELLCNIIRMSKLRTDPQKCRHRICITSDIREKIKEINQKATEEQKRKHGGEEKLKNKEYDTAKEEKRSEKVKANKEQAEKRAKDANDAALASVGGDNVFSKWKIMAEARQKPSPVLGRNSTKLSGGRRLGKNHGSQKVVRSISVKDVIAVVEKDPQMARSTLLYRLCNRI